MIESNGSGTVDGSRSYGSAGAYTVEVCVSDDDGDSGCDSLAVVVVASSTSMPMNAYLRRDGQDASHNPVAAPGAPAGVFTIQATFTNVSTVAITDLFFLVTTLDGNGGITFLNASSSPGGADAVVPVPLGANGTLEPGETFTVAFEIAMVQRQSFAFVADAYGSAVREPLNEDGAGFRFDVDDAQLRYTDNVVYLPVIAR